MSALAFYTQRMNSYSHRLDLFKRYNVLFILIKITLFVAILVLAYFWMVHHISPFFMFITIIGFAVVFKFDLRFMRHYRLLEALIAINRKEIEALSGNIESFDDGLRYQNSDHAYSFDLDIFGAGSLYQTINRSVTAEGADLLANHLTDLCVDADEIKERQEAVNALKDEVDWRQTFAALGYQMPLSLRGLDQQAGNDGSVVKPVRPWVKWVLWLLIGVTLMAVIGSFLDIIGYQLPVALIMVQLLVCGLKLKDTNTIQHRVEAYQKVFDSYNDLLRHVAEHPELFTTSRLQSIHSNLSSTQTGAIEAFKQMGLILNSFNQRSNLFVALVFNSLFVRDVFLLMRYQKWMRQWSKAFPGWVNNIAELDALVSLSNYAYNHPDFCVPQMSNDVVFEAHELGHPLIDASVRVCNDFKVPAMKHFHLVTGANMAGKSTFLRTVGVNLVLAACGTPVCARSFCFKPMKLFSSMRTSDNLVNHTSYFQAELLRLKKLIDSAKVGDGLFVILDEILKGTNSRDKLAGSRLFLLKMIQYNTVGMVATHDLALGELESEVSGRFSNVCFEITIGKDDILYDYKLKPGMAHNLNATWLLNKLIMNQSDE